MGSGEDRGIRKGDRGFLLRLVGGAGVVVLLAILVLGILDDSRLGSCAARGFLQVTDTPSSD
ncbi:MAG: hypothetical protein EP303_04820 [Deltaproteobacteria bacterium]|nr:MAG: hypothetical protein EP303_04820 [Deltaproteobacteria bacterium]